MNGLPLEKYNELYDNERYTKLSAAIANELGIDQDAPTQKFLDIMVDIQDKAIAYSNDVAYVMSKQTVEICEAENVKTHYDRFIQPFVFYISMGRLAELEYIWED